MYMHVCKAGMRTCNRSCLKHTTHTLCITNYCRLGLQGHASRLREVELALLFTPTSPATKRPTLGLSLSVF